MGHVLWDTLYDIYNKIYWFISYRWYLLRIESYNWLNHFLVYYRHPKKFAFWWMLQKYIENCIFATFIKTIFFMSIDFFQRLPTLKGTYIHQMSCTGEKFYAKISFLARLNRGMKNDASIERTCITRVCIWKVLPI